MTVWIIYAALQDDDRESYLTAYSIADDAATAAAQVVQKIQRGTDILEVRAIELHAMPKVEL